MMIKNLSKRKIVWNIQNIQSQREVKESWKIAIAIRYSSGLFLEKKRNLQYFTNAWTFFPADKRLRVQQRTPSFIHSRLACLSIAICLFAVKPNPIANFRISSFSHIFNSSFCSFCRALIYSLRSCEIYEILLSNKFQNVRTALSSINLPRP